jgi:ATP-dependent DNA helicase RecQ
MKFNQHKTPGETIRRARRLRREMPKTERLLWQKLRGLPPELGLTFRRQHPIHPFIVDFACIKIKLAIELDGDSHDARQKQDKKRDEYLQSLGYLTMRFTNNELMSDIDSVVETIIREAAKRS